MTFSIVAADPTAGECGVAVASKFLSAGAVVPWARGGVGAIATQSYANTSYGPAGLDLLANGVSPQAVIDRLTAADPDSAKRQLGIVDMHGGAATFSGRGCFPWFGGLTADHVAVQGNILVSQATVTAMLRTFQTTTGTLAGRLLAALKAGDGAGGDRRGKQSAALLVVKPAGGYGGLNDRYLDLRVDDHPHPVDELERLTGLWRLYSKNRRMTTCSPSMTRWRGSCATGFGSSGMTRAPRASHGATGLDKPSRPFRKWRTSRTASALTAAPTARCSPTSASGSNPLPLWGRVRVGAPRRSAGRRCGQTQGPHKVPPRRDSPRRGTPASRRRGRAVRPERCRWSPPRPDAETADR